MQLRGMPALPNARLLLLLAQIQLAFASRTCPAPSFRNRINCRQSDDGSVRLTRDECSEFVGCCWDTTDQVCYADAQSNRQDVSQNLGMVMAGIGLGMFDSRRGQQLGSQARTSAFTMGGPSNDLFNFMSMGGFSYNPFSNNQLGGLMGSFGNMGHFSSIWNWSS